MKRKRTVEAEIPTKPTRSAVDAQYRKLLRTLHAAGAETVTGADVARARYARTWRDASATRRAALVAEVETALGRLAAKNLVRETRDPLGARAWKLTEPT